MELKKLNMNELIGKDNDQNIITYQQEDDKPTDEISMRAIDELFSSKKLKNNSRLKFDQIKSLTKLYMFTEIFGEKFTKNLADTILQLQISTYGLGRKEIVQLVQQRNMMLEMQAQQKPSKDVFR